MLYSGFLKVVCTIFILDEMYELLSRLAKNVAYTCVNCTGHHPPKWRTALEKDFQSSMRQVLTALLNSRTSTHLLHYRQVIYFLLIISVYLYLFFFLLCGSLLNYVLLCHRRWWSHPSWTQKPKRAFPHAVPLKGLTPLFLQKFACPVIHRLTWSLLKRKWIQGTTELW